MVLQMSNIEFTAYVEQLLVEDPQMKNSAWDKEVIVYG
jgi:hypothetical protein